MSDKDNIFFSIIVPLYNRAQLVKPLIDNLSCQTELNFELIIIDDGSTDNPKQYIPSKVHFPIRYLRKPNGGAASARNEGIRQANAPYVAFLDSDDLFEPEKLAVYKQIIERTGATMIFSYAKVDRGDGIVGRKPSRGPRPNERFDEFILTAREPAHTSSLVVEKELASRVKFDERLKKLEDIHFCICCYLDGAIIHFIDQELSTWTDKDRANRLGNIKSLESATIFMENLEARISRRALYGYKANLLSYEVGNERPLLATFYILQGLIWGGVGLKRSAHSFMRAVVPQSVYRPLVNWALKKGSA